MDSSGYDRILTTHHRLSASLKTTTPVYSLSQWLERHFQETGSDLTLLMAHQQLRLIKTFLREESPELEGLAPLLQSAWRLTHQYKISLDSPIFTKNEDTQLFQTIALKLRDYYKKHHFTDLDLFAAECKIPEKTGIVGFYTLTPLEKTLLEHCTPLDDFIQHNTVKKAIFDDVESEFKNLVLWASTQEKSLQIGCVIPDLEAQHDKLTYYFDYIFGDHKAYTFSAVKKFTDYYFVQDILNSLIFDEVSRSPSQWAEVFHVQLQQSPLISARKLTNDEYQLNEKFNDIFLLYKNYDAVVNYFSAEEARDELLHLCSRIPFQPTASKTAHIHVLSLLESKGLTFDKLWVTGMDSRHWPNKTKQNPFCPFPHVMENTFHLTESAADVILSYPQYFQEEKLIPCELLSNLEIENINLSWPAPEIGGKSDVGAGFISPVAVDINQLKHHGSQIFKDHIACPFRAFAKYRLNAQSEILPQLGFNALQKGNMIHEILEKFFTQIRSQENLSQLSPEETQQLIDSLINNSLMKYTKNTRTIFVLAERARLQRLILDWLELEKSRENFTVIATEKTIETHLGQLPLKLRIDRIDQIGENKYLIIDYKTSQYDIRGDYLDEPQLPLYAVVSAIPVESIAYAYLRTGNSKLKQIPVSDLKQQWESELLKIAEDFLRGNAEVKPKYGEETCRLCDLKSLCRIKSSPNAPLL